MSNTDFMLLMTEERIEAYFAELRENGVAEPTVNKYRTRLKSLYHWLGEDKTVTAERLNNWRKSLESRDLSKPTVQGYVAAVNTFLRRIGYESLCIPKLPRCDLSGKTFGYLTAIEPVGKNDRQNVIWRCKCKCGKEVELAATLLTTMNSTSCGCLKTEKLQHSQRYVDNTSLTASLKDDPISERAYSGYTGVRRKRGKWEAYIQYKRKMYILGKFSKLEDAVAARAHAKALVMDDARALYEQTDYLFGEAPSRPPKPIKVHAQSSDLNTDKSAPAKRADNKSGHTGVFFSRGKWLANIAYKGTRYVLGYYDDINDAVAVRKLAEKYVADGDLEKLKMITARCLVC